MAGGFHSSTYKGKRVRVKLKNGDSFVDKFKDSKGHHIIFEEHGKVPKDSISNFTIFRNVHNIKLKKDKVTKPQNS